MAHTMVSVIFHDHCCPAHPTGTLSFSFYISSCEFHAVCAALLAMGRRGGTMFDRRCSRNHPACGVMNSANLSTAGPARRVHPNPVPERRAGRARRSARAGHRSGGTLGNWPEPHPGARGATRPTKHRVRMHPGVPHSSLPALPPPRLRADAVRLLEVPEEVRRGLVAQRLVDFLGAFSGAQRFLRLGRV